MSLSIDLVWIFYLTKLEEIMKVAIHSRESIEKMNNYEIAENTVAISF